MFLLLFPGTGECKKIRLVGPGGYYYGTTEKENELKLYKSKVGDLESRLEQVTLEKDVLSASLSSLKENELKKHKRRVRYLESMLEQVTLEKNNLSASLSSLQENELKSHKRRVKSLESILELVRQERDALSVNLSSLKENDLKNYQSRVIGLEARLERVVREKNNLSASLSSLTSEKEEADRRLKKARREFNSSYKEREVTKKKLAESARLDRQRQIEKYVALEKEKNKLGKSYVGAMKELAEAKLKLKVSEEKIMRLTREQTVLLKEVASMKKSFGSLSSDLSSAQEELAFLKKTTKRKPRDWVVKQRTREKNLNYAFTIDPEGHLIRHDGKRVTDTRILRIYRKYKKHIDDVYKIHGVPQFLMSVKVFIESTGDPNAVSEDGAEGLGQLMPGTQKYLGVTDPFDPRQNLLGTGEYFAEQLDEFNNIIEYAVAAYYAGPEDIKKALLAGKTYHIYPRTTKHVKRFLRVMRKA